MNISAIKSQQVSFGKKEEAQKEPRFRNKGFIRASIAKNIAIMPFSFASVGIVQSMLKNCTLTSDKVEVIKDAAEKAIKQTGLDKTGLEAHYIERVQLTPGKSILGGLIDRGRNALKNGVTEEEAANIKNPVEYISTLFDKLFGLEKTGKDIAAVNIVKEEIEKSPKSIISKISDFYMKQLSKVFGEEEFKEIKHSVEDFRAKTLLGQFKLGMNSAYFPRANKILVSENTLSPSVFHEIGHALNNNFSKVGRVLQKMRPVATIAVPIISLLALTTKRKTTDKPSDRKINNGLDFIKKNAGQLTFLAFVPMLIEEGMATVKGNGLAKKILADAPSLIKKVKIGNALGFASYTLAAVASAIAIRAGIRAKDNIQSKYEIKKTAKLAAKQAQLAAKAAQTPEA